LVGVIPKLVARTRRNGEALSGHQNDPLAMGFHRGLAGENEEKLLRLAVGVTHLGCAGRHAFLDYAQLWFLQQMPSVTVISPNIVGSIFLTNGRQYHIASPFSAGFAVSKVTGFTSE